MITTNQNLEEASTLQKKSSGKYKCLIGIIILALIIVGGVLFFLLG
jgi:flagellar basal body-associated protein FliL